MKKTWQTEYDTAHARAFSVAASLPAAHLEAMDTLVRSLVATATPWTIAKPALQQSCDALAAKMRALAPTQRCLQRS
jgi:hypothetical protein